MTSPSPLRLLIDAATSSAWPATDNGLHDRGRAPLTWTPNEMAAKLGTRYRLPSNRTVTGCGAIVVTIAPQPHAAGRRGSQAFLA